MMSEYLDFKPAKCKNCYKCLRECPVKAIDIHEHQAKIISERCILCGHCTLVCPQNAKVVHTEIDRIKELLDDPATEVIASVAPSFVSSFETSGFGQFGAALRKLSFRYAEETAVGASIVTAEYHRLLRSGEYKNLISSACPAICRLIQLYYPDALKYLAPVDSPMIAHAKLLRKRFPDAKIIFIGPCIAKKREAAESGLIDGVLTFEELKQFFAERGVEPGDIAPEEDDLTAEDIRRAKYYPIRRGIIKSFGEQLDTYEYVAVDGPDKSVETLSNIDSLEGMFIEMNSCTEGCINGPCSMAAYGRSIKAMSDVNNYVRRGRRAGSEKVADLPEVDLRAEHRRLKGDLRTPNEEQIRKILARTGKLKAEDELNCGACGYSTCREKAVAVFNGYVDIDVCLPYMRERAESMSYEIIQNTANGIVVLDNEFNVIEINSAARRMLGIEPDEEVRMRPAADMFDIVNFVIALTSEHGQEFQKVFVPKTKAYINQNISLLKDKHMLVGVMTDITDRVGYNERLTRMREDTLGVADEVIKKQMRVAQEIASLLGETTAETKVALLKLKEALQKEEKEEK